MSFLSYLLPHAKARKKRQRTLPVFLLTQKKTESVSIYYGSICYSFYDESKETIERTADLFHGFSLEEVSDGALDSATTYQIYFSNTNGQTAAINVDENSMFYLADTKKIL